MDRTHTRVQARGAPSEGTGLCRIPWNVQSSRGAPVAEGGSREGEQHKAQQVPSELAASSKAFPPGAFWAKITPGHSPFIHSWSLPMGKPRPQPQLHPGHTLATP